MFLEAAIIGGLALSSTLSGAALACCLSVRRSAEARARRVARGEVEAWKNRLDIRLSRLEEDERVEHKALELHGIMAGRRICPPAAGPGPIRLHEDERADADAA